MTDANNQKDISLSVSLQRKDIERIERMAKLRSSDGARVSPTSMMRMALERSLAGDVSEHLDGQAKIRTSVRVSQDLGDRIAALKDTLGTSVTELLIAGLDACEQDLGVACGEINKLDVLIDLCKRLQEQNSAATNEVIRVAQTLCGE